MSSVKPITKQFPTISPTVLPNWRVSYSKLIGCWFGQVFVARPLGNSQNNFTRGLDCRVAISTTSGHNKFRRKYIYPSQQKNPKMHLSLCCPNQIEPASNPWLVAFLSTFEQQRPTKAEISQLNGLVGRSPVWCVECNMPLRVIEVIWKQIFIQINEIDWAHFHNRKAGTEW